jgi:hypothetical protein
MADENPDHGARQVTVQPQAKPVEAGRPRVPLRRVKQPGEPPPESNDTEREEGKGADSARTDTAAPEH